MKYLEAKAAGGPAQNKALQPEAQNKQEDLDNLTVAELKERAEKSGVEVKGTGDGGRVLKSDYVKALR